MNSMPRPEEVSLLLELCATPSPSGQEGPAVRLLVDYLSSKGWEAKIDAVGNAMAETGSHGRSLLFLGHVDTVPGVIPVRVEEGKLYGRGSVDAKGALAAFVCAVERARARLGGELPIRVTLVGAVGEETAFSPGARYVRDVCAPDLVIVGEPSGWDSLTIGYRGCLSAVARVRCPSAHSAGPVPSAAERAIGLWTQVVAFCEEYNRCATDRFTSLEPRLKEMSTTCDGLNEEASLGICFRLPPGIDPDELKLSLLQAFAEAELEFSPGQGAFRADKNTPLSRAFLSAIRAHGASPRFKLKGGTSDMNLVGPAWGVPILAYGPGDSALDHTPNEHLWLEEYGRAISVLEHVLTQSTWE